MFNRLKDSGKGIAGLFSRLIPSVYRQDQAVRRSIYKWLLIGLLIRLAFMPITVYFPDLLGIYLRSSFIAYYGIVWIGKFQAAIHYMHAFFLWIFKPLMPYFSTILSDPKMGGNLTSETFTTFVNHLYVFRTLFIFKLPYLFFELGCVFILLNIFQDSKRGLKAFKFWMINPVVIFATYLAARYEVMTIFFILLSLYYAKNNFSRRSLLCLGLAIIIRFYPLILLPFFVVILGRKLWERLELIFWGLLPLGIISILGKLFQGGNEISMLMKTHHSNYLLSMGFHLGFVGDYVFIFPLAYTLILLYVYFNTDHSFRSLWKSTLILLLTFFATCFFHVHYLMWLMPLLALQIAEDKRFVGLFSIQVLCFVIYTFQWKKAFAGGLFAPISPSYFMSLRSPFEIINQYYSASNFIGIFRSIFSGVCFWMIYLVFKESFLRKKKGGV